MPISRLADAEQSPVDRAFVAAAQSLGFERVADLNESAQQAPSVGPAPKNVADGVRMNGAFTYLAPARERSNLRIVADVLIDRVRFAGSRAVEVLAADGRVFAGRTIVVCGGAYGSPAILLRSGVGPAAQLREFGIPLVADRPGVGENLRDHPLVNNLLWCAIVPGHEPNGPTFIPMIAKARSTQAADEIDLHVYQGQSFDEARGAWTFWLSASLQHAHSRGRVRLTARDPEAALDIDHDHLSDPRDLEALCDGVELVNRLAAAPPLAAVVEPVAALRWRDRDELRSLVRENVGTTYHPSSTCRMGPASDPLAVVDHRGRVHGLDGLRVIDASIFPTGPRANLQCPIVAAAEKLAEDMRRTVEA